MTLILSNSTLLFTMVKILVAGCALLGGTTLFFMGPRLVARIAHTNTTTQIAQSLLVRWVHLFILEAMASSFIVCGLYLSNLLLTIPISVLLALIVGIAFVTACLLSSYI